MKDETQKFYRTCFSTPDGRRVLGNLMGEAGFGRVLHTPEEIAKENFVKMILAKIGITEEVITNNLPDKLFEIPVKYKEKNEGEQNG